MGAKRKTFTLSGAAGAYAVGALYLNDVDHVKAALDRVAAITVAVESLPAGATLELQLLKPGTAADTDANWFVHSTLNALGVSALIELAGWPGARVRGKSGAAAGDLIASISWERTR